MEVVGWCVGGKHVRLRCGDSLSQDALLECPGSTGVQGR